MYKLIRTYGFFGLARLSFCWFVTKLFFRQARLIRLPIYIRGKSAITWGRGFTTGVGVRIDAFTMDNRKLIIIGDRVQINDYVHIGAIEHISIGNDVLIASKVFITDHNHGRYNQKDEQSSPNVPPAQRPLISAAVIIEDRVWIGENVSIMPGVKIGSGAVIGAGSVVTHDMPSDCICVGIPARVVKRYNKQLGEWLHV